MITSCWPERLSFEASFSSSSSINESSESLLSGSSGSAPLKCSTNEGLSLFSVLCLVWPAFPRPARAVGPGEVEVRPVVVRLIAGLVAPSGLSGVRVLWERGLVMRARGASCRAAGWWFSVNGSFWLLCDSGAPLNGGGKAWGRDDWRDRDIAIISSVIHCDSLKWMLPIHMHRLKQICN